MYLAINCPVRLLLYVWHMHTFNAGASQQVKAIGYAVEVIVNHPAYSCLDYEF